MLVLSVQSQSGVSEEFPMILVSSGWNTECGIYRKHLLVSLGEECYLSLPKGQLPVTSSDDPRIQQLFPVPGGGHILIIPISHHPTLRSLPAGEKENTLGEVEKSVYRFHQECTFLCEAHRYSNRYKSALRSFYGQYNTSPVFFEMAKKMLHGVHAQIHVLPIPNSISPDEVRTVYAPFYTSP